MDGDWARRHLHNEMENNRLESRGARGSTGKTPDSDMTALAVAYQVQCRLSDEAPVRARGFDHTTQGSYAAAAGAAKALGLGEAETANAVAIAGTALNALRVTRTGSLSQWKGLAYPFTAFGAVEAAFLALSGVTGPAEVFEGNKGFMRRARRSSGAIDRCSRRAFAASVITSPPRTISACVGLIGASISTGLSSSSAAIPPSSPALTAKTRRKSECPISRR